MKPIFRLLKNLCVIVALMLSTISLAHATTYYSFGNTAPNLTANWWTGTGGTGAHPANFSTAGDLFIIQNGHTYTQSAAWSVTGSVQVQQGGTLNTSATAGNTLSLTGNFTLDGSFISANTGAKTITGNIIISSTGSWLESAVSTFNLGGNLQNDGSFTASTGVHTFSGTAKTISGANVVSIASVTITGTVSNDDILTIGTVLAGGGTLTNTLNSTLNLGGTISITNLIATAAGNLVNYNRAGTQTVKNTIYSNLTISGTSAKTLTGSTVNGILSVEGTATTTGTAPTYGTNATLQYKGSGAQTTGVEFPGTFSGTGGVLINNTNGVSLGGTKTIAGASNLTIGNTVPNSLFSDNGNQLTCTGTLNLTSGKFKLGATTATTFPAFATRNINAGTTVEYGATAVQIISATPIYANLILSGVSVKTPSAGLTVNEDFTISAGTFSAVTYTHNIGGDWINNGIFTATTSTINMNGSGAGIIGGSVKSTFYDLTVNKSVSSSTVTCSALPFATNRNLTITSGNLILNTTVDLFYTITGTLSVAGAGTLSHFVTYDGAHNNSYIQVNTDLSILGTYVYTGYTPAIWMNGSGARTLTTGSTSVFYLLLRQANYSASGNVTVDGPFYAMWNTTGGSFSTNGNNIVANWGIVNAGGTFTVNGGSVVISGGNGGLLSGNTLGGQNGALTMSSGTLTTDGLNMGLAGSFTATMAHSGGTITTTGLNIATSSTYTFSTTAPVITVNGDITNSGTITTSASGSPTINLNGNLNNLSGGSITNTPTSAPNFIVSGNITNGGTLSPASNAAISLKGNWINNSTFTPNTSTVTFNGTSNQTIGGTNANTFNNLVINASPGVTVSPVTNNVTVNSDLTVSSGIFDLGILNCNRASAGGTLTVGANATLRVANSTGGRTGSNYPNNFNTNTLTAGTVEYYGGNTVNQTIYAPVAYGNLVLTNGTGSGLSTKSISANITSIAGNLTVGPFATFDLSTFIANRATAGGTLSLNANAAMTLAAASGGQAGSNYPSNFTTNALDAASTVNYSSATGINQTVYAPVTYGNLNLTNTSGSGSNIKTLTADITGIAGNLSVGTSTTYDLAAFTSNRSTAGGTFTLGTNAVLKLAKAGNNYPLNFSTNTLDATSTVDYYAGNGINQTVYAPVTYGKLVLSNVTGSGSSIKTLTVSVTNIASDLTVSGFATFDMGTFAANRTTAGGTMTVAANGILKLGANTGGRTGSNFPNNFTTNTISAGTVEYNGASGVNQVVYAPVAYGNLILSNSTGSGLSTKSLTANTSVALDLTINGFANFDLSTFTANRTTAGGTLLVNSNATLLLGGASGGQTGSNYPTNFSTNTLTSGTVNYNGANGVNQTVYATPTYGNLILSNSSNSGSSTKILSANITAITGNLTVNSFATFDQLSFTANRSALGGTFTLAANAVHRISGITGGTTSSNFPNNFSAFAFSPTATTEYYGGAQTIYDVPVYGNLTLLNAGSKSATSATTSIAGNFVNTAPSTFNANNGTVDLLGTSNQSFAGVTYNNLTLSNGAVKTLAAAGSITKELLFVGNTTLALGNNDLTLISTVTNTANVATIPSGAAITYGTGKFVVERYLAAKKAWRFISTPVKTGTSTIYDAWQSGGATTSGFGVQITGPGAVPATNGLDVVTQGASLKYYNPVASGGFTSVLNTKTELSNDKGYFIFVRGDRTSTVASGTNTTTVLRTRGEIITGAKAYTVPVAGYASVGNPYPSRIDLRTIYSNGGFNNVTNSVTVWDPQVGAGAYNVGLYRTYTRNTTTGDFVLTPGSVVNNYIESGQAFYVQSTTGGTLNLTESVKTSGSNSTASRIQGIPSNLQTNLYAIAADGTATLTDGTLTDIDDSYTGAIDNMDVRKTLNTGENIGISKGGNNLIVERRNPFATDTVFYNISGMKQQNYSLEFVPENIDEPGLTGYLIDKFLQTSTPVSLTANTTVNFTVNATPASYAADRFKLVFQQALVLPVTFTSIEALRNRDNSIAVNWKVENELNIKNYTIEKSANGRDFSTQGIKAATNASLYTQNDQNPFTGDNYYRIKATGIDGHTFYSATVKVTPSKASAGISIYPNPVVNKTVQVQFTNQPAGIYNLTLTNKLGQVMYTGSAQITGVGFAKSLRLNDNTQPGIYELSITNQSGIAITKQVLVSDQ